LQCEIAGIEESREKSPGSVSCFAGIVRSCFSFDLRSQTQGAITIKSAGTCKRY
jgi:hypothetical protein